MWRFAAWTLRQRRYRAAFVVLTVLALAFVAIGTFEVHRFQEKRADNAVLRANARAAAVTLTPSLLPLTGSPAPADAAVRYRTVRARGEYLPGDERFVGGQRQGGREGFLVLTPLRTADGVLLVARGFVAATDAGTPPRTVAAPPTGTVTVTGMLYPGQGRGRAGADRVVTTVDPTAAAARLGAPAYQAYLALGRGRPGTAGLRVLPGPDLSNPTGGAGSAQLLSYVFQWYAFAGLALASPFLLARHEAKDARRRFLGIDEDEEQFDLPAAPALEAPDAGPGTALEVRARGELARAAASAQARATRLADRYGRPLGPDGTAGARLRARRGPVREPGPVRTDSARVPHRSEDEYHGSYNDHLWQLALADGQVPDVEVPDVEVGPRAAEQPDPLPPAPPRVVDVEPVPEEDR